jgi:FkbM family methyltransferase
VSDRTVRARVLRALPASLQPVAQFHFRRLKATLDPEMAVACRLLRPGVTAIDVGANNGLYTHAFARTGARVEAFEPQSACLHILRSYERGRRNVRVHDVALGDREGEAVLHVPRQNGVSVSGHARIGGVDGDAERQAVAVRTLDSFGFPDVAVIKVDVEGHEAAVLRGAAETIRRWRPMLIVEIEQRHLAAPIASAFEQVLSLGYDGSFLDAGETKPIARFDAARHQRAGNADNGGYYINNFVFTPRA